MKISKELEDSGLTKEILLFFHSRTANSQKNIVKVRAALERTWDNGFRYGFSSKK